jgi:tetratricopeptide (TPR) repeat protein
MKLNGLNRAPQGEYLKAVPTEIEKLERRWQENPLGLTFAPLAEAYRKSGSLSRALELLDAGLAQHPGYVPAHIVRGRCHLDSGERALAELDFLCVTELDPENVIALKALADLAEEEGRTSDAIQRLESLLEIDRNNEEAENQLVRLREESPAPAVSDFAPRDDSAELTPSDERMEGIVVSDIDLHLPRPDQAQQEEPSAPVEAEALFEKVEVTSADSLADLPEELNQWLAAPVEVEPVGEEPVAEEPVAEEPVVEEPVAEEPVGEEPVAEDVVVPEETTAEAVVVEEVVEEPAEEEPAEPDLMVTETMAEIFLRQGHRELALAVYTQLLQREPENERVKGLADELARSLQPAPEPVEVPPAEPPRRYDAASTGGRPVQAFLGSLFSVGRPRPAPAVHPPAFDRDGKARAPSFDEFFAVDTPQAPASMAAAEEVARVESGHRAGDAEELEQFHAWLRGLKT